MICLNIVYVPVLSVHVAHIPPTVKINQIMGSIKTHDSESQGQEEAGRTRDEQVSYLHVAPL